MVWPLLACMAVVCIFSQLPIPKYTALPRSDGHTSTIYLLPNHSTDPHICKSIHPQFADVLLPIEQEVYERFSANNPPSSLLSYHGIHDEIPAGLVLEFAELGNLQDWLLEGHIPGKDLLYKWGYQVTEALEFAHGLGVLHADIHCLNFFLTKTLDLKVGDWGGASIDGARSYCSYRYSHRLFRLDGADLPTDMGITTESEIFALGTALYVMVSGQQPWPELEEPKDREEIRGKIARREFPNTRVLDVLGSVIERCWSLRFTSMTEIKHAIEKESYDDKRTQLSEDR
ncbi:hypothetical protein AUEXF2481DRAFT_25201 [Aureobasidium subglaciale EXF-2481]|uniref:Protein kinase domain-containing protein n=1 Tax=Aureobasidium subglaciale (strain EXF-2481) TaxID=1043005 RepID=A0A074YT40_AURSE|nr:uncharacterized protein AUEXF2481DRAFT_25201 [Aureobasidium subglaciale EXF-2481]KER00924.1 hypothetical protein AUEXF2481DRAFT_25201 [Aureobasidium subglaciale EXF-2481]